MLIADEPVSAQDVSVQSQVLNLLAGLSASRGLALLFISHNLAAVNYLCDLALVIYMGKIVGILPRGTTPAHPYTQLLAHQYRRPGLNRCLQRASRLVPRVHRGDAGFISVALMPHPDAQRRPPISD